MTRTFPAYPSAVDPFAACPHACSHAHPRTQPAQPRSPHAVLRKRSAAFTLIEILIVTFVIAIAAMLVLPSVASTHTARLNAAGKLLAADLQLAQLRAMGNSADPCMVVFSPDDNEYHLALSSTPATPITNPATNEPYLTTFGTKRGHQFAGVTFDSLSVGGDDRLAFTSLGQLDQATDATITLRCADQTLTITINAVTGQTSIN